MAIGTPYNVGSVQNKDVNTLTITTVATVAAEDLIHVAVASANETSVITVTDSAGNTYYRLYTNGVPGANCEVYSSRNSNQLTAGQTITITSTLNDLRAAVAVGVSGITAQTPMTLAFSNGGTGTNPVSTIGSGQLSSNSRYYIINFLVTNGPEGDTFTQDTANGWSSPPNRIGTIGGAATTNSTIAGGYKIFTGETIFTWSPTITSRSYTYITLGYVEAVENTLYYLPVASFVGNSNTSMWASTSGGTGGAGSPTGLSTLIFDENSTSGPSSLVSWGSGLTYDIGSNEYVMCKNIIVQNINNPLIFKVRANYALKIFGDATLTSPNLTFEPDLGGNGYLTFASGGNQSITTAATTTAEAYLTVVNNTNLEISSAATFKEILMEHGTLSALGNITAGRVRTSTVVTGVPKTINMGSGTWTINANDQAVPWDLSSDSANVTLNACPTLIISPSTPPGFGIIFQGGGKTYKNLVISGLALNGDFLISGSNNFNTISSTITTAWQLRFAAISATTNTFKSWQITGTPGNVVTLRSNSDTSQATLSKPGPWNVGINSTDISGNTGLNFTGTTINYLSIRDINGVSTPAQTGAFFLF